jgi:hypothetical protein
MSRRKVTKKAADGARGSGEQQPTEDSGREKQQWMHSLGNLEAAGPELASPDCCCLSQLKSPGCSTLGDGKNPLRWVGMAYEI